MFYYRVIQDNASTFSIVLRHCGWSLSECMSSPVIIVYPILGTTPTLTSSSNPSHDVPTLVLTVESCGFTSIVPNCIPISNPELRTNM